MFWVIASGVSDGYSGATCPGEGGRRRDAPIWRTTGNRVVRDVTITTLLADLHPHEFGHDSQESLVVPRIRRLSSPRTCHHLQAYGWGTGFNFSPRSWHQDGVIKSPMESMELMLIPAWNVVALRDIVCVVRWLFWSNEGALVAQINELQFSKQRIFTKTLTEVTCACWLCEYGNVNEWYKTRILKHPNVYLSKNSKGD